MKHKYTKVLSIALSAAMLLAGCAAQQTTNSTASEDSTTVDLSQTVNNLDLPETASDTSEATGAFGEAFSKRDLSGEYDASDSVAITLNGTSAKANSDAVAISGSTVTITAAGTYIISGKLENGTIIVNASKEDKVQLVLNGVSINSDAFAAIYVLQADKVFITLADGTTNTLSNGGTFTQIDDNNVNAVIYAKDDITLNGNGSLQISSPDGNGIVGKDDVTITSGNYEIAAANHAIKAKDSLDIAGGNFSLVAGKDGLHAENDDDAIHANTMLQIDGGTFDITAAEGLEGTYIQINDGTINISASDDGINAAYKSSAYTPTVEINGGEITIVMGAGDTDGIDSNGNLIINGGTIDVTGRSTFDYDGSAQYNGGTIIVNGQRVDSIPSQMMGGRGGMMGGMNGNMGGGMNGDFGGGMHGGKGWRSW